MGRQVELNMLAESGIREKVIDGRLFNNENEELKDIIKRCLPENYNFEICKTVERLKETESKHVILQFPEGLLVWANTISYILKSELNNGLKVTILGDVTYGACCIEDISCSNLGGDFLIHYGHSCLIPIHETVSNLNTLYIFVDIEIDTEHIYNTILHNFKPEHLKTKSLALLGVVQYSSLVLKLSKMLNPHYQAYHKNVVVPSAKPLSRGEVLGCTSPNLNPYDTSNCSNVTCNATSNYNIYETSHKKDAESEYHLNDIGTCIFLADGRFHLESAMIQNPNVKFYRYDPFSKRMFEEAFERELFIDNRKRSIIQFRKILENDFDVSIVGLCLSTLGRQGSVRMIEDIEMELSKYNHITILKILSSEILPSRLEKLKNSGVMAMIQIACPRLSIDWGHEACFPLLSPFEFYAAIHDHDFIQLNNYPMDFYALSQNPWSNKAKNLSRNGTQTQYYKRKTLSEYLKKK